MGPGRGVLKINHGHTIGRPLAYYTISYYGLWAALLHNQDYFLATTFKKNINVEQKITVHLRIQIEARQKQGTVSFNVFKKVSEHNVIL